MPRVLLLTDDDYLPRVVTEVSREQGWDLSIWPDLPPPDRPVEHFDLAVLDARPVPYGKLVFSSISKIMLEKAVPLQVGRVLALAYYDDLVGRNNTFVNGGSSYLRIHPHASPPGPHLELRLTEAMCDALALPEYEPVDFHAAFPNRDFYREALESLQVPVLMLTSEGTIKLMNLRALATFDYTTQMVIDRNWSMLVAPADRGRRARDVLVRIGGGHFYESTLQLVDRHGKEFPVLITSSRVFSESPAGDLLIILAIHDLTEMEDLQRQLTMFQKIESVERVVAGMTHEFNNALTAILGHAELLAEDLDEGTDLHESAVVIRQECGKAQELTGRLLGLSSSRQFVPGPVSCREVVMNTQALLRHTLGEGIRVITDLIPSGDVVIGQEGQLQQMLVNLCLNARDAMTGEGVITIQTSIREVLPEECRLHQDWTPGIFVELAVADTGCGMSEDVLARVFEPFFTTKPAGSGSGLGLSVVRGIAQSHGGHVAIESRAGRGTKVMVRLPQSGRMPSSRPGEEADAVDASEASGEGRGILVVDDEHAVLSYTQKVLERAGYQVWPAVDGELAVSTLEHHRGELALVILDVTMPGDSGRRVLRQLRRLDRHIPVILCTAYAQGGVDDDMVSQVQGFLKKPFRPRDLLGQVREVLESADTE